MASGAQPWLLGEKMRSWVWAPSARAEVMVCWASARETATALRRTAVEMVEYDSLERWGFFTVMLIIRLLVDTLVGLAHSAVDVKSIPRRASYQRRSRAEATLAGNLSPS